MSGSDFDLSAASLRFSTGEVAVFVEVLASKLEAALPRQTHVTRRPIRLFAKEKRVERIEVELAGDRFVLGYDTRSVDVRRARVARGVVLKTESPPLERWLDELGEAVAAEAQVSEEGRRSLQRLLGTERAE